MCGLRGCHYLTEGQGSTFVGDGRHVTMNHLVCGGRGGEREEGCGVW